MLAAAAPAAAIQDNSIRTPIETFLLAFNGGNMNVAANQFAPAGTSIIDEFSPYYWIGPTALTQWAADHYKDAEPRGISDGKVTAGKSSRTDVAAGVAYAVAPAHYTFKQNGIAMIEDGTMTFALAGKAKAWKIAAWTWSGPTPKPAKEPQACRAAAKAVGEMPDL